MSNVRYGCPTNPDTGCGTKHFAAPGGTTQKCRFHDVVLVQMEEWHGPTFEYIEDAQGRTRSGRQATHLRTHTPTEEHPDILTNITPAPNVRVRVTEDEVVVRGRLAERYKRLYRKDHDKRWSTTTLRKKVETKERVLEEESARRSAQEKAAAEALAAAQGRE